LGFSPFTYDFTTRPQSPTLCVLAAERAEARATLSVAAQTRRFIIHPDTLSLNPATVQTAQTCGRQWSPTNTSAIELPGLFRLALLAGQPDRAMAAGTQWVHLAGAHDTREQGERLYLQLFWILESQPRTAEGIQLAKHVLDQLRQLGPRAAEQRINALEYMGGVAAMHGDISWARERADTIRQVILQLPTDSISDYLVGDIFSADTTIAQSFLYSLTDIHSPDLQKTVEHFLSQTGSDIKKADSGHRARMIVPATFDAFMFEKSVFRHDSLFFGLHVTPLHPLAAQHWYGRPDTTVTYPRRGVTTVVFPIEACGPEAYCPLMYATYARWRQLYTTFAPKGVEFILMVRTHGSFGLSTRLTPQAEVDSLRTYFRDHLKLPGMLGISETGFVTLPDGRKVEVDDAQKFMGIYTADGLHWGINAVDSPADFEKASAFLRNHTSTNAPSPKPGRGN
jgi:hypothetical protein